jgi:hypothetical protein
MSNVHTVCAITNFFCFMGFVTAILLITSHASDSGHDARRRSHVRRALAFVRVT